jgi:predicted kinase
VRAHRVRDGHGDLRLEHCYLGSNGSLAIIDCIEFNERFRYADVAADIAFLSMDLLWHERQDLSEALLAAYARASGDFDLYGVIDFYESYRAYVRGKVSAMLDDDAGASQVARERARAQARKYFLLASACAAEPVAPPTLYAVAGIIASGKSTVAERLAGLIRGPIVDADRIRKQQANVDETTAMHDAPFQGHYGPADTAHVYAELLRRAEVVLRSGRPVVLDASFRARAHRVAARELAARCGAQFMLVECHVERATARERLVQRATRKHVSDGRAEILDAFIASFEPIDELAEGEHLRLDTSQPIERTVELLAERVL